MSIQLLADQLTLGGALDQLRMRGGGYQLLDHWQQGEFHHDTVWFDPCDLLKPDARSELREEFRERETGGGWRMKNACAVRRDTNR